MKTIILGMIVAGCTLANAADPQKIKLTEISVKDPLAKGISSNLAEKKPLEQEISDRAKKSFLVEKLSTSKALRELRGGQEGNGGGVHYCPTQTPQVQLYDLYEGAQGLVDKPINVFKQATGTKDQMIEDALTKLKNFNAQFAFDVRKQLRYFRQNIIPVNLKLREIPDANYLGVDPGCTYEQLANWDDRVNKIFVSFKFANLLKQNAVSEAAFEVHEAIYKTLRQVTQAQNSDKVRRLVAYLFSTDEIEFSLREIIGTEYIANAATAQSSNEVTVQWGTIGSDDGMIMVSLGDVSDADLAEGKVVIKLSLPEAVGPGSLWLRLSPEVGTPCVLISEQNSPAANNFSCEISLSFDQMKKRQFHLFTTGNRQAFTHKLPAVSVTNVKMELTKVTANRGRITAAPIELPISVSNLDYDVIINKVDRPLLKTNIFGMRPSMNPK